MLLNVAAPSVSSEFRRGFACALAELIRTHGHSGAALSIMETCRVTFSDLCADGINEDDLEPIRDAVVAGYGRNAAARR